MVMDLFSGLAAIPLGLVVGSFVGLVADRWPRREPVAMSRSRCQACGVTLSARELVPAYSYLRQAGRCKHCGVPIGIDALVAELGGAAVAVLAWISAPDLPSFAALAVLGWSLLLLGLLDFRHLWLPNRLTLPLLAAGCALGLTEILPAHDAAARLLGAAAGFGLLAAFRLSYRLLRGRDGLGAGDEKLLGAIGAWLGIASLPLVLLLGASAGLAYAAILHLRGQRDLGTVPLPLGTFLALAAAALMPFFA